MAEATVTKGMNIPPTGIYEGILQEDMVKTIQDTHKQYIKVWIEGLYEKDGEYPYTYVPDWGLILPLRGNDHVLVRFEHGSLLYPVLYRNPNELDPKLYEKFEFPDAPTSPARGTKPTAEDTVSAVRHGADSYTIYTDNYTVIHRGNNYLMMDKDGVVQLQGSTVRVYATGEMEIIAASGVTINGHLKVT